MEKKIHCLNILTRTIPYYSTSYLYDIVYTSYHLFQVGGKEQVNEIYNQKIEDLPQIICECFFFDRKISLSN